MSATRSSPQLNPKLHRNYRPKTILLRGLAGSDSADSSVSDPLGKHAKNLYLTTLYTSTLQALVEAPMVRPRTALTKSRRMTRCPKCGLKINRQRTRCKNCAKVQPKR